MGLAFATTPSLKTLNLAGQEQLVGSLCKRHAVISLRNSRRLYADGFRFYFTPLFGVLFTFPSRYLFTIGLQVLFSLGRWSCRIHSEFLVFRVTREIRLSPVLLRVRDCHPYRQRFPSSVPLMTDSITRLRTPTTPQRHEFGLAPLRSPLLRCSHVVFSSSGY